MLRYLDGDCTLDEAREETVKATRRFARRQESWFRRDTRVRWLDASITGNRLLDEALGQVEGAPGMSLRIMNVGAAGPVTGRSFRPDLRDL